MTSFPDSVQPTALVAYNPQAHPLALLAGAQAAQAQKSSYARAGNAKQRQDETTDATDRVSRTILEDHYLNTYKALYLGGQETLESGMIRSASVFCTHSEEETAQRLDNYSQVAGHLGHLTDEQLATLLTTAKPLGSGMGGEVLSIKVGEIPVFIKKIRLTDIEREHPRSTQNIFELPAYYQYGVGSMGFGAWRELAAHEMTTQWVLNGECQNFPLMYHSRVLERPPVPSKPPTLEELEDRQFYVEYWGGSSATGKRVEAAGLASADVVVFMESLSQNLNKWLAVEGSQVNLLQVEKELNLVTAFMKSRGFLHFDAHFDNILTNNQHIYFADFGLAMSQKFDLSLEESAFFERHIDYDRYYVVLELARSAVVATLQEHEIGALDAYFSSKKMTIMTFELPSSLDSTAQIAQRYRSIAILMNHFFNDLREYSKSTPFPDIELLREWTKL